MYQGGSGDTTVYSITSIIGTEFVKKKTFKVYVEGGFAFGFLDFFIREGDSESGVACKGKFFGSSKS